MTTSHKLKRYLLATAVALPSGATISDTVFAQQQGAGPLEEIVVSARRREESIQSVPTSVVAFDAQDLEVQNIETGRDLSNLVPNLVMGAGGLGQNQSDIRIRGIPDVGVYVDGVWQGDLGVLSANLVEMQRVEVLRGPQGTLFGRNTNGGAIQYITEPPAAEAGGHVEVGFGKFKRRDIKASIDIPVSDTLYTKWTAARFEHDGYFKSVSNWDPDGTRYGDRNDTLLRGDVLWEPNNDFSLRVTAFNARQHGTENRQVRFSFQEEAPWFENAHLKALNWLMDQPDQQFPSPAFTPEYYEAGWPGGEVGKWETKAKQPADAMVNNSEQYTGTLNWDISNNLSLESITAYRTQFVHQLSLQDAADFVACCRDDRYYDREHWSEEVHLTGSFMDGMFDFLLGGYYSEDTNKLRLYRWWMTEWYVPDNNGDGNPELNMELINRVRAHGQAVGDPDLANYSPLGFWVFNNHEWTQDNEKEKAIFGEVDWNATDRLQVTVGARLSWRDVVQNTYRPGPNDAPALFLDPGIISPTEKGGIGPGEMFAGEVVPPAVPGINEVHISGTFTPKLSVRYHWTDDVMTYATYSEGFSEGGIEYVPEIDEIFELAPETVVNYEVGIKSDLFDRAVRFNASGYYSRWNNLRVSRHPIDPETGLELPTPFNTDDGKAEVLGAEADATWFVTNQFRLNFSVGYLDTKYLEIGDPDVSSLREDARFAFAPKWSYAVGAEYNVALPEDRGRLTLRGDWGWQSKYERDPSIFRHRDEPEPGYGLLSARITYTSPDESWSVAAWGRNLTNQHYVDGGFVSAGLGFSLDTVGPPREYGLKLRYNF